MPQNVKMCTKKKTLFGCCTVVGSLCRCFFPEEATHSAKGEIYTKPSLIQLIEISIFFIG